MPITQAVELDASAAVDVISSLDDQLQQVAQTFKVALADALDVLNQPLTVAVDADTAPAAASIDGLAAAPPVDVLVDADTTAASASIDALASAPPVDVPVSADTSTAEADITALANQPPVDVTVDANTEEAQAALEQLTLFPPVDVIVQADTGSALTSVDDLRAAAEQTPITMQVEADTTDAQDQVTQLGNDAAGSTGQVEGLTHATAGLDIAAGAAAGSARPLLGALGDLGPGAKAAAGGIGILAGSTAAFFNEGLNAVSAGQRFNLIVGDMADKVEHVDVFGLDTSMEKLGITFGSTTADMHNTNAQLIQLAKNSGASGDQAVQFTQQIEGLSARAISLNPNLGTLSDVMDSLGVKIGRGGRFAAQYGLDLNAAEIATRALSDTGKTSASDLTFMEKAIAGAELASEKYGGTVKADVEQGSQNAAVQVRSLKASFTEAIEAIGKPIVAPVIDLLKSSIPIATDFGSILGDLAKDALPAVQLAVDLINPPLHLLADILGLIPSPVISAGIAFFGMRAALSAIIETAPIAALDIAGLEAAVNPVAGAFALGVAALSFFAGGEQDAVKPADDLTQALKEQGAAAVLATNAIEEKRLADNKDANAAHDAGVSYDLMNRAIQSGTDDFGEYVRAADSAGTNTGLLHDQLVKAGASSTEFGRSLLGLVDSGKLSGAQVVTYVQTIERLHNEFRASTGQAQHEIDANKEIGNSASAAQVQQQAFLDSLNAIGQANPAVALTYKAVTDAVGDQGTSLQGLAIALDNAKLKDTDLGTIAQGLGVDLNSLKGFIKATNDELNNFVSNSLKQLPTVSTAIDEALDPKKRPDPIVLDPVQLQKNLDDALNQIGAFNENLAFLTQHGFNNLAQIAAQRGPEFTQALVTSIQNGGDELGASLDGKFGQLNTAVANEGPLLRDAGQGIEIATGDVARNASQAFGDAFQLAPPTQEQIDRAHLVAELSNVPFSEALKTVAGNGAAAYEQAIGVLPQDTQKAIDGSVFSMNASGQLVHGAGGGAGGQAHSGFAEGIAPIPQTAAAVLENAGQALIKAGPPLAFFAGQVGVAIGETFDQGIAAGINDIQSITNIRNAASAAVRAAEDAARAEAQSHSPSEVFARVGRDLGAGMAVGIIDSTDEVARAAELMVAAAIPSALTAGDLVRSQQVTTAAAAAAVSSSATLSGQAAATNSPPVEVSLIVQAGAIQFQGSVDRATARAAGAAVVDGALQRLTERQAVLVGRVTG